MKLKNVWPENKVWAFLKVSYVLGGYLELSSELSGYSVNLIKQQATARKWIRGVPVGSSVKGKNYPFRKTRWAAVLAQQLNSIGISKRKIGTCFGVSESFIGLISKEYNWTVSSKGKGQQLARTFNNKHLDEICSLYSKGASITSLSKQYGFLSRGPIKRIVKKAGLLRSKAQANSLIASSSLARKLKNRQKNACTLHIDMRRLSKSVYELYKEIINPDDLPRSRYTYHLDHIYSIDAALNNYSGLRHPPNIWEICHPANLRMLYSEDNIRKSSRRDYTTAQLRMAIREWNNIYLDPYFIADCRVINYIRGVYGNYDSYGKLGCASWRRYYKTSDSTQCQISAK